MSLYTASLYNSTWLNATAASSSLIYQRDVSLPLNATIEDARNVGTLTTDLTQLDIKGQVLRENPAHFYKFTLDGDSLKATFLNATGTASLRMQILDSDGDVVADSSTTADDDVQEAYAAMASSAGLDLDAGDYYVKMTFDSGAVRSLPQTYSIGLYSGTRFAASYQTTAKAQTSTKQTVLLDDTMTYSLIDAAAYETKTTQLAGATTLDATNIGWLYENKAALAVSSQLTDVVSGQYFSFLLQEGSAIKMAFNNHTGTADARVQLYDSMGTKLLADSHGTEEEKEAYAALTSSDGLAVQKATYLIKVSYAVGEEKTKQIYDFKLYTGETYEALYKTIAGTESASSALASGRLGSGYSVQSVLASYLQRMADGTEINVMDVLGEKI